jgi:hypothetical protein
MLNECASPVVKWEISLASLIQSINLNTRCYQPAGLLNI